MHAQKIYILGLAGTGKTYLANKLSQGRIHIHTTDWLLYNRSSSDKRVKLSRDEYLLRIKNLVNEPSWIVEGVHFFHEVARNADIIVFIDPTLALSCIRILQRYFTNSDYRKVYSFRENLNLIRKSVVNYYSKPDKDLMEYPKYKNREKFLIHLKKYKGKTRVIRQNTEIDSLEALVVG